MDQLKFRLLGPFEVSSGRRMILSGGGKRRAVLVLLLSANEAVSIERLAVYTHQWSKDGAPPGADWSSPGWAPYWIDGSADGRGKVCLTPPFDGNVTAHEMCHGFGMQHDVGPALTTASDYADPCCIMSQNGPFVEPPWNVAFGPAACLPHLTQ